MVVPSPSNKVSAYFMVVVPSLVRWEILLRDFTILYITKWNGINFFFVETKDKVEEGRHTLVWLSGLNTNHPAEKDNF